MDPISAIKMASMLLSLMSQAQGVAEGGQAGAVQSPPPQVNASSLGDVSEAILKCYHPTGRFRTAGVVQVPWPQAAIYNAEQSALLRIEWNGDLSGAPYVTLVGLMARGKQMKTQVQGDNAPFRPNPRCQLAEWVDVAG